MARQLRLCQAVRRLLGFLGCCPQTEVFLGRLFSAGWTTEKSVSSSMFYFSISKTSNPADFLNGDTEPAAAFSRGPSPPPPPQTAQRLVCPHFFIPFDVHLIDFKLSGRKHLGGGGRRRRGRGARSFGTVLRKQSMCLVQCESI